MKINQILEKYKLTKTFETGLKTNKEVFVKEFGKIVEDGFYSPFLIMLDAINTENKKYIGKIDSSSFKIRERFVIDNSASNNFAIIKTEFREENNILKVKTKIIGMEFLPFIIRVIIFGIYLLMMLLLFVELLIPPLPTEIDMAYVMPPILVTWFVYFMTYRPYRIARKNIKEKKSDIDLLYQIIEKTPYNNV